MLTYRLHIPAGAADGATLLVLLHGRGSDENDLLGLAPGLPPDVILVTPRAPFPGAPWGYGGGWAWYRFLGGTTPEPAPFEASVAGLASFLEALPDTLPVAPGQVVIGGFSQGATTALGFSLIHPDAAHGLVMFSGFLPSHPAVRATPETVRGRKVFWGHGTLDPMIPYAHGAAGRRALAAAGADLTTGDYPIGHTISPQELADAARWLSSLRCTPAEEG